MKKLSIYYLLIFAWLNMGDIYADVIVPILTVTGSKESQYGGDTGGTTAVINRLDVAKPNALEPSTWTQSNQGNWHREYTTGGNVLVGAANNKITWIVVDLGTSTANLTNLYLWNATRDANAGIKEYDIYIAEAPTTVPPVATHPGSVDYDFGSGGWTLVTAAGNLTLAQDTGAVVSGNIHLGDVTARYIGLEVFSNYGNSSKAGVNEIALMRADYIAPAIASANFVDNKGGASIDQNALVTYNLSFSEDMDDSTFSSADFSNAGTSSINIGAITEISSGNFTVQITPTTNGTLQLQIPAAASLFDYSGNPLDTSSAIADDTTITVATDVTSPTILSSNIIDGRNGNHMYFMSSSNMTLIYTLTFSEDIDSSTVSSADFSNAGTATMVIGAITEVDLGVFEVEVNISNMGTTLQFQISAGATIDDAIGNSLDTSSAIADDNILNLVLQGSVIEILTIPSVYGNEDRTGGGGNAYLIDGTFTQTDPIDPNTWSNTGTGWANDFLCDKIDTTEGPTINNKLGWIAIDLGESVKKIQNLFLWNSLYNSGNRGVNECNIYYSVSPTVTLSTGTDYDFGDSSWIHHTSTGNVTFLQDVGTVCGNVSFTGITARYIAIEVLSNHGDSTQFSVGEVVVTKSYIPPSKGTVIKFD